MSRRVDRVEQSITTVIVKIDAAITKLENLDRMKMHHRERMTNIMTEINAVCFIVLQLSFVIFI
jgi:hypothetical protein